MISCRHSGDAGDIIYSLPVLKWITAQNQCKAIFYIEAATYTRVMLTRDKWNGLDLILREQSYIHDVQELRHGNMVQLNLNDFRASMTRALRVNLGHEKALVEWMMDTHKVPRQAAIEPWLQIPPLPVAEVVINRTGVGRGGNHIYHNATFPWRRVVDLYGNKAVFIGTPEEHAVFCAVHGPVDHYKTANLYEAARVISGCKLFIGNQSCPHAIAEGLKKPIVLEVWEGGPNCLHFRDGVIHGRHDAHKLELPNI